MAHPSDGEIQKQIATFSNTRGRCGCTIGATGTIGRTMVARGTVRRTMAVNIGDRPFTLPYDLFRSPSVAATGKPTAGREAPIPLIGGIEHCILPRRGNKFFPARSFPAHKR